MLVNDLVVKHTALSETVNELQSSIRKLGNLKSSFDDKDWLEDAKKDKRNSMKILVTEYEKVHKELDEFLKSEVVPSANGIDDCVNIITQEMSIERGN